jgi:hypothetical protein
MKKAFFRLFNIFMAIVVLTSSTGFGVVEHSCTVKGKQTSLTKSVNGCCSNAQKPFDTHQKATLKKSKCCNEEEKYENVDYSSSATQKVAKFTQKSIDWVKETFYNFTKAIVKTILENIYPNSTNSSSESLPKGRDILVFVQSFLI